MTNATKTATHTPEPEWIKDTKSGVILGVNRRSYPSKSGLGVTVIVVLVQGAINDYAAYAAATSDEEWAKRNGDKVSFEEACVHFPGGQLHDERYRR